MIAFAVVTDKESHIKNAELEKSFSGGRYEFECFANLENAIDWVTKLLKAGYTFIKEWRLIHGQNKLEQFKQDIFLISHINLYAHV